MRKVEVIAISAGFDCHQGDLASLGLTSACFLEIGKRIGDFGKCSFGVLEGGYSGEDVGGDLDNLLKGLAD
jgi:acetoin utilization deacetylase AcuC-like enzyme